MVKAGTWKPRVPEGRKREREATERKIARAKAADEKAAQQFSAWVRKEKTRRKNEARRIARDDAFKHQIRVAEQEGHPDPVKRAKFVAVYLRDKVRAKSGKKKRVFEKGPTQTKLNFKTV